MKKKLLHVIESAGGGALQYVIDICNVLPPEEWDIEVVYSRRYVTPQNLRQYFDSHVKLTEVTMTRSISVRNDIKAFRYMYKLFRSEGWHLIHLHSSKAGALGRLAARGLTTPVVYTPHGFAFYQQDISNFSRKIYYRLENILNRIYPAQLLVSSMNEYTDAVRISKDVNKIKRIPNSVPIPCRMPKSETQPDELLMITVGRFTSAKNPLLMLDIIESLTKKVPNLRFVWIGDGEQREFVTREARGRGLPFEVTGWLERNEIEYWYRKCDVYVQCSSWEGLPIALLEAMSFGCAVVVSDIPAHRELVKNGVNGIVAGNREEFVAGILKFFSKPEFNMAASSSARQLVEKVYSIEQFGKSMIEFYQSNMKEGVTIGRSAAAASFSHHTML